MGIGQLVTYPINQLVVTNLNLSGFSASLNPANASVLVALSIIMTLLAGFVPSRLAARKNPVEALRTE